MKKIGIKLADGTFYPLLDEGSADKKEIALTTVKDNQTTVKVDVYRSELCSMEDAEYVDTLKISNLKKEANGEPTITLSLGLDENGRFTADLVDSETGGESSTSLSLFSEGEASNEGKGLLEIAEEINSTDGVAIAQSDSEDPAFDLPDFPEENAVDINFEEPLREPEKTFVEEPVAAEEPALEEDLSFELPSFEEPADIGFEAVEADVNDISFDPPDFSETASDDTLSFEESPETAQEGVFEKTLVTEDAGIEEMAQDAVLPEFDLPEFPADDFDSVSFDEPSDDAPPKTEIQEAFGPSPDTLEFSDNEFDMPDFDENSVRADTSFDSDTDSFDGGMDSFESEASENDDDLFVDFGDEDEPQEEAEGKGGKFPMMVCLVCAIICVLAVLFFVINAKSIFGRNKTEETASSSASLSVETKTEPAAEPAPVPSAPAAKEDEIVVVPQAETVVPDLPPEPQKKSEKKVIRHKIKWGDTLWDLAAAYYKNPWRYPKIAAYNNIKNPNHIIAGTYIEIPEE